MSSVSPYVPPPVVTSIVPLDEPALRASVFSLEFDGGSFLLRIFDFREDPEVRVEPVATKRRNVEIARFAISPVAFQHLEGTMALGRRSYVEAMGHELPDQAKIISGLIRVATEEKGKQEASKAAQSQKKA